MSRANREVKNVLGNCSLSVFEPSSRVPSIITDEYDGHYREDHDCSGLFLCVLRGLAGPDSLGKVGILLLQIEKVVYLWLRSLIS